MAFIRYRGKTKFMWYGKAASTVFADGALVYFNGSGFIIPADATSGAHIGVIRKAIAATDDDYTSNTLVPVEVPVERWVEWEVLAASAVSTDIGLEIDLTDSVTADRANSSKDALLVTGYKSATKLYVTILSNADIRYTATT